ncbi:MAG: hypothetical protein WBN57_07250 [Gammaproteobacteria bacterium]
MSNYEMQIQATSRANDAAIIAAEQEGIEILSSVVSGSRLHELIHNPIDSGIDKVKAHSGDNF